MLRSQSFFDAPAERTEDIMGLTIFGREYGLNPVKNLGNDLGLVKNVITSAPGAVNDVYNLARVSLPGSSIDKPIGGSQPTPQSDPGTTGGGTMTSPIFDGGYGGGGSGSGTGADANLINQIYDSRIGRLQSMLGRLPSQMDSAKSQYEMGWEGANQQLNNSAEQGRQNLAFQEGQNQQNKARSFRDIAQGIRGTLESAANRLGAMNATDSSASPMLAYALANLQAQQRGQANDVFNTNAQQIGMARTNMENDFQTQLNALQNEKRSKINQIAEQFAQTRQQILDEIANSSEQRAQELAGLGQQYTMKALSDIQGLEDQYNSASQTWVQNALGSMPKVNTQAFNPNVQTQSYGTYGRGAPIQDNVTDQQITDAYDSYGLPLRKNKDQFSL